MGTEMHLDLCIQSTRHLLETVSKIKENVRILEVFINSGLTPVGATEGCDFSNSEYSKSDEHQSSYGRRSSFGEPVTRSKHSNCCCMCQYRQRGFELPPETFHRTISRASAATVSVSSNQSSFKKSRNTPIIPRLNKTASLRRESVLKQQKMQDRTRKPSMSIKQ